MSICTTNCRSKGNCCKSFGLNLTINKDISWGKELKTKLKVNNLEFLIPKRAPYYDTEYALAFQFDCTKLGKDGLCTDYENRPDFCKRYIPKQDELCCEYVHTLKGIPIILKE